MLFVVVVVFVVMVTVDILVGRLDAIAFPLDSNEASVIVFLL